MSNQTKQRNEKNRIELRNTPEYKLAKSIKDRENYQLKKNNGLILSKKKIKLIIPKPAKIIRVVQKLKVDKLKPEVKQFKTLKQDLSTRIPLLIKELKMTVYIKPGDNIELIKQKYLNR